VAALTRRRAGAALAAALLLASPGAARAHAGLVSSAPAAGDTLRQAPTRVVLRFTEPVDASSSGLVLLGSNLRITLAPRRDPGDVTALVAALPPLGPGGYRVQWRTLSADGHPVYGSFVFFVAGAGAAVGPAPPEHPLEREVKPSFPVLAAVLRAAGVGSLAALAGVLMMMVASAPPPEARVWRLALALAWAAPALLAAHALAWAAYARGGHGDGGAPLRHLLFETGPGHLEMTRAALALLALWALALARRPGLALGFAALAIVATGLTGHPAALHPAWTVPAKAIHVAAVALWTGGLAVLYLTAARGGDHRALALRVSSLSLAAVVALTVTGAVQAWLFAPSLALLANSTYGAVLLAKLLGMAVLVAIGARNRWRLVPRLPADDARASLRRAVRWELAVMALVLLAAGVLAYVPVPHPHPHPSLAHTTHVETN
jgi:copper transport protein